MYRTCDWNRKRFRWVQFLVDLPSVPQVVRPGSDFPSTPLLGWSSVHTPGRRVSSRRFVCQRIVKDGGVGTDKRERRSTNTKYTPTHPSTFRMSFLSHHLVPSHVVIVKNFWTDLCRRRFIDPCVCRVDVGRLESFQELLDRV